MLERMERETGIEPATSSLGSWHSTAELLPLNNTVNYPTISGIAASVVLASVRIRLLRLLPQPLTS